MQILSLSAFPSYVTFSWLNILAFSNCINLTPGIQIGKLHILFVLFFSLPKMIKNWSRHFILKRIAKRFQFFSSCASSN